MLYVFYRDPKYRARYFRNRSRNRGAPQPRRLQGPSDANAYGRAREIVELHREIDGLDGTPIFRTLCGAVGRSLELREHPRERERERQGTEAPCFPRECSGWREPPPFFSSRGAAELDAIGHVTLV